MSFLLQFSAPLRRFAPGWLLLAAVSSSVLMACGESDKSTIPVAEVGDRVITLDYFERKMNSMDPRYVPKNIAEQEGRMELLETMINKEVMAIKAEELGFGEDENVNQMADAVSIYNAVALMKSDVVKAAQDVSEEEILDYYENFQRSLDVSYMLFDTEADAIEARRLVAGGEDWFNVAQRLNVGPAGDSGNYTLNIRYGTLADDLEQAVFALEVGEISEPVSTIYGWFIVRLDGQSIERVDPLEDLRPRIVASVQKQKGDLATQAFIHEVFEEYNFKIDEEVIQVLFDALPEDWEGMPPPPVEELPNLDLDPSVLDGVLMSFGDEVWTLRRFQGFYNELHALGRPRREQRLGGLRRRLEEMGVRELMPLAARARGYTERQEIQDQSKERKEQAMVTQLHSAMVKDMVRVTPAEVDAYWAEHKDEYHQPERRDVRALVAATEADAMAAHAEAQRDGVNWSSLVERYGAPGASPAEGQVGLVAEADSTFWSRQAFNAYGAGDVVGPNRYGDGQWALVKVVEVQEERMPSLDDVRVQVGNKVKAIREEELFQERVEEWKANMTIKRYPDNLDKAELTREADGVATANPGEGAES